MKSISATIICKNESANVARLLGCLSFADQIVVVDTGSTDDTVAICSGFTPHVYHFGWRDDFSKARNYAISKANCNYVIWLDADDVVPKQTQRAIAQWKQSKSDEDFCYLKYQMGNGKTWFWRERIVRRCAKCRFCGFIHETIKPFGKVCYLNCPVLHHPSGSHEWRNLQIYQNALRQGKRFTARDTYYYARTLVDCNLSTLAKPLFCKVAINKNANVVDRVDCYKMLACYAQSQQKHLLALRYLSKSVALLPPSAEISCLFGSCYLALGSFNCAVSWYQLALANACALGFVNDDYCAFVPHAQLAVCYWYLQQKSLAKQHFAIAQQLQPNNPAVVANAKWFA